MNEPKVIRCSLCPGLAIPYTPGEGRLLALRWAHLKEAHPEPVLTVAPAPEPRADRCSAEMRAGSLVVQCVRKAGHESPHVTPLGYWTDDGPNPSAPSPDSTGQATEGGTDG